MGLYKVSSMKYIGFAPLLLTFKMESQKIVIDGVLDENLWSTAKKFGNFYHQYPIDGVHVNKKTVVKMAYEYSPLSDLFLVHTDDYVIDCKF